MEEEIEVGEYVKTEGGLIAKYLGFEKDKHLFDNEIYWYYEYYIECVYKEDWKQFKEDIVKHSKNLIDLIEAGDIVEDEYNKYEVAFVKDDKIYCNDYNLDDSLITLREQDIKAILTKEQFEANCYKVGGEDE